MPRDRPPFPPWLGVAVAVASVSFAAPLFRLAEAPPLTASFWRLAIACILLLPFAWPSIPRWRGYSRRDWALTALAGVALALHFGLWVTSLFMTTVAAATVLVTLQCVFVALGGHWLLGDRLSRAGWLGVAVAVVGGLVIALGDAGGVGGLVGGGSRALLGDVLAFLAGLGSAAYMLVGRKVRHGRGLVEYVLPVYAICAFGLLVGAVALRQPLLAGMGTTNFTAFVLLAAVPMLGGHTVSNWVLRHLPAHTVATWILLEPVGAALLAWALIPEAPTLWTLGGGVLVLAGAALTVPHRDTRVAATEPAG